MDQDKARRILNLKVIASEIVMVVAVILTVLVLVLIVSGYWLNSDFKVERQGLLQVSSIPTGADVDIDGDSSWFQRTNTSKTLSSGEHTVTLSKEDYDTWSKTITIREGLLYRLHYPRLFLKEREVEKAADASGATFATVSPDRNTLLVVNGTYDWVVMPLNTEIISPQKVDVRSLFLTSDNAEVAEEKDAVFSGVIESADWANDNAHILLKVKNGDRIEWVILDIDNAKDSINLSRKFDMNFDKIKIMNNSANSLLALQGQSLRRIDVASGQISVVLVDGVMSLDHYDNEAIYVAKRVDSSDSSDDSNEKAEANKSDDGDGASEEESLPYALFSLEVGSGKSEELIGLKEPAQVVISRFYDDKYIVTMNGSSVVLYQKNDMKKLEEYTLTFNPEKIKVGHDGEFFIFSNGLNLATLDMEALAVREWQIGSSSYGWLDNDMLYDVTDGDLVVYDFDGLNKRSIAKKVTSNYPVTITEEKWLYYFSDGSLMREWLIKR